MELLIPAFIAGVLTFLAPCTLPLVPGYLAFISGTSLEDLKDPAKAGRTRLKIFLNGVFFIVGFSVVFIALGSLVGLLGSSLVPYRIWLTRVGGAFVILFGLFMLNVLKLPFLHQEKQLHVPQIFERGKPANSLMLGLAFGFGWTPCVGPILGSILFLASATSTALQGAFLLFIFSLGLSIPFLAVALGVGHASHYLAKLSGFLSIISVIGGVFLIFLGILLFTNNMGLLISYGYRWLEFINYDRLIDYL